MCCLQSSDFLIRLEAPSLPFMLQSTAAPPPPPRKSSDSLSFKCPYNVPLHLLLCGKPPLACHPLLMGRFLSNLSSSCWSETLGSLLVSHQLSETWVSLKMKDWRLNRLSGVKTALDAGIRISFQTQSGTRVVKKRWLTVACLYVWSPAMSRKCIRYSGSVLIENSSRTHHMQIFSCVRTYPSSAVSSQWWGKERNPLLLQPSRESPDTSAVPAQPQENAAF